MNTFLSFLASAFLAIFGIYVLLNVGGIGRNLAEEVAVFQFAILCIAGSAVVFYSESSRFNV
jgi:hypothetical protein